MGAANVSLVFARWAHLPDRSFRLLTFMALVSMDADPVPRFWGGREAMAVALGRIVPDEPAPSDMSARAEAFRKARRADFEAVKAALRGLTGPGVVTVDKPAARGRNAVYALHLAAATGKADPAQRGRNFLSMGQESPVDGEGVAYPLGVLGGTGEGEEPNQTQGGTSPASSTTDDEEMTYSAASRLLTDRTADLGASWLARVPEDVVGMQRRVIAAAGLLLAAHRPGALRPTAGGAS